MASGLSDPGRGFWRPPWGYLVRRAHPLGLARPRPVGRHTFLPRKGMGFYPAVQDPGRGICEEKRRRSIPPRHVARRGEPSSAGGRRVPLSLRGFPPREGPMCPDSLPTPDGPPTDPRLQPIASSSARRRVPPGPSPRGASWQARGPERGNLRPARPRRKTTWFCPACFGCRFGN